MLKIVTVVTVVGGVYGYDTYRYNRIVYNNTQKYIRAIDDKQYHALLDYFPITYNRSGLLDHYQVITHAINVGDLDALGVLIHHNRELVIDEVIRTAPSQFINQCMVKFPGVFNQYDVALTV